MAVTDVTGLGCGYKARVEHLLSPAPTDSAILPALFVAFGNAGGRIPLPFAAPECLSASVQPFDEFINELGEALGIRLICYQVTQLSPFFFVCHVRT